MTNTPAPLATPSNVFALALLALQEGEDRPDDGAPGLTIRAHSVEVHDVATTWWVTRAAWDAAEAKLSAEPCTLPHTDPANSVDDRGQAIRTAYDALCDELPDVLCFNGSDGGDVVGVVEAVMRDGLELLQASPLRDCDPVRDHILGGRSSVGFYMQGGGILDATPSLVDAFLQRKAVRVDDAGALLVGVVDGVSFAVRYVGR